MYDSASSAPSIDRAELPMLIDSRGNSSTIAHMAIDGSNTRTHSMAGAPGDTLTQFPETAAPIVSVNSAPSRRLERLNSIRKVLSFTEFWDSLPAASKFFLIISIVDAAVIIAFSIEQLVAGDEFRHIVLAMLVTAIFFLLFVFDAIIRENAFGLLASMVMAACVAGRVVYYVAAKTHNPGEKAVAAISLLLMVVTLGLGYITYRQFGWRVYSKLATDLRIKNAEERRRVYILANMFTTLLRLDIQFYIILFMIGLDVSLDTNTINYIGGRRVITQHKGKNTALIITNSVGLLFNAAWCFAAYLAVKWESQRWTTTLQVLAPISYIMPIVDILLVFVKVQPVSGNADESITITAALCMIVRSGIWLMMRWLVMRFKRLKRITEQQSAKSRPVTEPPVIHTDLIPLMRGAWLGKPSITAPRKRRFFQLSNDGSTLRWAWNKYILLYYVQDVVHNDDEMEITLTMTLDPDLHLRFFDAATYVTWKRGLELLLTLLFAPGGISREQASPLPQDAQQVGPVSTSPDRQRIQAHLLEAENSRLTPQRILKKFGITVSRRRSTIDPENRQFKRVAERAVQQLNTPLVASSADGATLASGTDMVEPAATGLTPVSTDSGIGIGTIAEGEPGVQASPKDGSSPLLLGSVAPPISDGQIPGRPAGLRVEVSKGSSRPPRPARSNTVPAKFQEMVQSMFSPRSKRMKLEDDLQPEHSHPSLAKRSRKGGQMEAAPAGDLVKVQLVRVSGQAKEDGQAAAEEASSGPVRLRSIRSKSSKDVLGSARRSYDMVESEEKRDQVGPLPGEVIRADGSVDIVIQHPHVVADAAHAQPHRLSEQGSLLGRQRTESLGSDGGFSVTSPRVFNTIGISSDGSIASSHDFAINTRTSSSSIVNPLTLAVSVEMILYEELAFGKFLGKGAEGAVYAAWYLETPVAVKQTESLSELEMNLSVGMHDNIVALRGLCQKDDKLYLVMEYCPRGTLDLMLHHTAVKRWDPAKLVPLVRSIVRGMLHLHTRRPAMLHRDLKPANIFVGHGLVMKIGDFGMSRQVQALRDAPRPTLDRQLTRGVIGTAAYAAPELLGVESPRPDADSNPSRVLKADVYSFGVTLWEILEKKRPFDGLEGFQIQAQWYSGADMTLPPVTIPDGLSNDSRRIMLAFRKLVADCTAYDPDARPSFMEIIRSEPLGKLPQPPSPQTPQAPIPTPNPFASSPDAAEAQPVS